MKKLLDFIIKNIVGDAEYSITQTEDASGTTFAIQVPDTYKGKIIGKEGKSIKAIRDVVNILARRQQKRIFIKILE